MPAHHLRRIRTPPGQHERAATAATPYLDVSGFGQTVQSLPHSGAGHLQHLRQFALRWQPLTWYVDTKCYRRHHPVDDLISDVAGDDPVAERLTGVTFKLTEGINVGRQGHRDTEPVLSLIHISEPTRLGMISY